MSSRRVAAWFGALGLLAAGLTSAAIAGPTVDATPAGNRITPAGRQVDVPRFPLGVAASPDGAKVVVSADNGFIPQLTVIDAETLATTSTPSANLFMGVSVTPGGRVYASGGNADRVFRYQLQGGSAISEDVTQSPGILPLHNFRDGFEQQAGQQAQSLPAGDGIHTGGYPGNSVLDGRYLYVAGTLSEPSGQAADACPSGQPACGRVIVIDTMTDSVIRRVPVGFDVYGLAIDPARHRLYATNWADESGRGGRSGGTVSVLDIANPAAAREVFFAHVGHHPTAVLLSADKRRLFVTNTNDDTISILDVAGDGAPSVLATESTRPTGATPVGAYPNALALSPDGTRLFVALASLNAVEVRDGRTGSRLASHPVYIPTGWYPTALSVTSGKGGRYRLWIVNTRGHGYGPGLNGSVITQGSGTGGSVNVVDLPVTDGKAEAWTRRVRANDRLDRGTIDPCRPFEPGVTVSQVLCPPAGKKSPIRHVVYIVTENKTFDQYFGDIGAGFDADPSWILYGEQFTPNHHALARRYSLSDRFFSDAEVSVTGHSWTSAGIATDHNEKTWPADYNNGIRGSHGGGDPVRPKPPGRSGSAIFQADDELQDPEGGYIFEAFKRAGARPPGTPGASLTMGIYGERTARESGDMSAYKAPGWTGSDDIQYPDTCKVMQVITGKAVAGPADVDEDFFRNCGNRTLPPQFHLAHWTDVWNKTKTDVMPSFIYMSLPTNHTLGTNLGQAAPQSMVADNDYAIGLLVDALSKSPFWGSTAVLTAEDDTQLAGDHVSPLRDYLQVHSPWAKAGPNHQHGSFPSLLRTIETIFHVPPFTLHDKLAWPQHSAFVTRLSDKRDTAPYTAVRPAVPFAINQVGAPGQAASMAMDWSHVDRIDEATLNAILYAAADKRPLELPPSAPR